MGHLAERYRDVSRSGVYRVTDAAVPRAAALEAGVEVLFIEGLEALPQEDYQAILGTLERVAAVHRERGEPFFAVLVDPRRRLALPTLYKEKI